MGKSDQIWGVAAAMAAICIYAGMFTVGRHGGANNLDGFDQTALRFVVSFVVLIPFALSRAKGILERLGAWRIVALLVLQGAVYSFIFLAGLVFAPVAYGAALVPGLQPFVVMGWSFFLLGERPGTARLIGLIVCLTGCGFIILGNLVELTAGVWIGIALFLLSALMWGSYTFLLRQWNVQPMDALFVVGVSSGVLFLPPYFLVAGASLFEAPLDAIAIQAVYQGVFVGIIAVLLMPFAVGKIGSTHVAALTPSMPVLATLFALLILKEAPTTMQWVGLAIVTTGLLVVQYPAFIRMRGSHP